MIKTINHNDQTLAIIISHNHRREGIEFFTPRDFSQQLGYMEYKSGKVIPAHVHNQVKREISLTKEVLIIRKGKLRVDFYDDDKNYLNKSIIIESGDVILLAYGGHGFEVIEDCEIIEVKQGPHVGDQDKVRFTGISANQATIIDI